MDVLIKVVCEPAQPEDQETILGLLKASDLPTQDLPSEKVEFLVARNQQNVVGCIGLEQYNGNGLLRSFAIDPTLRSMGLGGKLYSYFLSFCKKRNIQKLHLLTTTAERYFLTKGFKVASREKAPKGISGSTEFSELCPASSSYLVREGLKD